MSVECDFVWLQEHGLIFMVWSTDLGPFHSDVFEEIACLGNAGDGIGFGILTFNFIIY